MKHKHVLSICFLFFMASCSAPPGKVPEVTTVSFLVSKVVWPYPVVIEGENEAGLTENLPKAVNLVVVESKELAKFVKKSSGYVTAFVSFGRPEDAPKPGERYTATFRTSELWKVRLPTDPKGPVVSFVVLEDASTLKRDTNTAK